MRSVLSSNQNRKIGITAYSANRNQVLEKTGGMPRVYGVLAERIGDERAPALNEEIMDQALQATEFEIKKARCFTGTELLDPRIWSLCSSLPALVRIEPLG